MMKLIGILLISCSISLSEAVSLNSQTAAEKSLIRYRQRVTLVHELLLSEECPDLETRVKRRSGEDSRVEMQLEVEKRFFEELIDMLADCRQEKQNLIAGAESSTTLTAGARATPSDTAINLTEAWHHELSNSSELKPVDGDYNCDPKSMHRDGQPWFRITGEAGSRLLNHCIPSYKCGTQSTLWSNATLPVKVGVSQLIPVHGSYGNDCYYALFTCSVMRCSEEPDDFVYQWSDFNSACYYGFCGMS